MTNAFRHTPDGSLDRKYLRVCSTYRFFIRGIIDHETAVKLLKARKVEAADALVCIWKTTYEYRSRNRSVATGV